jgi:hypothetical protein
LGFIRRRYSSKPFAVHPSAKYHVIEGELTPIEILPPAGDAAYATWQKRTEIRVKKRQKINPFKKFNCLFILLILFTKFFRQVSQYLISRLALF